MKKVFKLLLIAGLFSSSVACALATLPHGHDGDLDHSQHQSCVVHQASFAAPATVAPPALEFSPVLRAESRLPLPEFFAPHLSSRPPSFHLRAPPASS